MMDDSPNPYNMRRKEREEEKEMRTKEGTQKEERGREGGVGPSLLGVQFIISDFPKEFELDTM